MIGCRQAHGSAADHNHIVVFFQGVGRLTLCFCQRWAGNSQGMVVPWESGDHFGVSVSFTVEGADLLCWVVGLAARLRVRPSEGQSKSARCWQEQTSSRV